MIDYKKIFVILQFVIINNVWQKRKQARLPKKQHHR